MTDEIVQTEPFFAPYVRADVIIMNPPFSQGRWQAHLDHALECLNAEFSEVLERPFPGVNMDMVMCKCSS